MAAWPSRRTLTRPPDRSRASPMVALTCAARDGQHSGDRGSGVRHVESAAVWNDRHVTSALGVGEIRHRRALLTAVPAPEHTVPALGHVAAPRVPRYRAPRPTQLLAAASQRRVVLVDGAFAGADP